MKSRRAIARRCSRRSTGGGICSSARGRGSSRSIRKRGAVNFSYWFRARQDSGQRDDAGGRRTTSFFISSAYYKTGSVLLRVAPDGKAVAPVWSGLQLEIHWTHAGAARRVISSPSAGATNRTRASAAWSLRPAR